MSDNIVQHLMSIETYYQGDGVPDPSKSLQRQMVHVAGSAAVACAMLVDDVPGGREMAKQHFNQVTLPDRATTYGLPIATAAPRFEMDWSASLLLELPMVPAKAKRPNILLKYSIDGALPDSESHYTRWRPLDVSLLALPNFLLGGAIWSLEQCLRSIDSDTSWDIAKNLIRVFTQLYPAEQAG